jgi:hypothetical protein
MAAAASFAALETAVHPETCSPQEMNHTDLPVAALGPSVGGAVELPLYSSSNVGTPSMGALPEPAAAEPLAAADVLEAVVLSLEQATSASEPHRIVLARIAARLIGVGDNGFSFVEGTPDICVRTKPAVDHAG